MHIPFFAKCEKQPAVAKQANHSAEKSPIEVLTFNEVVAIAGGPQITNNPPS